MMWFWCWCCGFPSLCQGSWNLQSVRVMFFLASFRVDRGHCYFFGACIDLWAWVAQAFLSFRSDLDPANFTVCDEVWLFPGDLGRVYRDEHLLFSPMVKQTSQISCLSFSGCRRHLPKVFPDHSSAGVSVQPLIFKPAVCFQECERGNDK